MRRILEQISANMVTKQDLQMVVQQLSSQIQLLSVFSQQISNQIQLLQILVAVVAVICGVLQYMFFKRIAKSQ